MDNVQPRVLHTMSRLKIFCGQGGGRLWTMFVQGFLRQYLAKGTITMDNVQVENFLWEGGWGGTMDNDQPRVLQTMSKCNKKALPKKRVVHRNIRSWWMGGSDHGEILPESFLAHFKKNNFFGDDPCWVCGGWRGGGNSTSPTRMLCIKSMWSIQTFAIHECLQVPRFWHCLLFWWTILVNHMVHGGGGAEPHWLKMISDHHWPFWWTVFVNCFGEPF